MIVAVVLSCKGTFQIQNYLYVIIKPIYKNNESININKTMILRLHHHRDTWQKKLKA